jgi:glycosyltransferase involved in cell wall biosynthesis
LEKYVVTDGEYKLWDKSHKKHFCAMRAVSRRWAESFLNDGNTGFAAVDDPIYFTPLLRTLKKNGIPIVAMCHNIESLVPGQVKSGRQRDLLGKEIDCLKLCHLAVTISREDYITLNNFNVKSFYLPYYPVEAIAKKMLEIRDIRKSNSTKDLLFIGSARNKPTQKGLLKLVKAWNEYNFADMGENLLIAGYNTEDLSSYIEGERIKLLGTLSTEELHHYLSTVKACICYQEDGTGALTKIQEMLIAGIPVLANIHAARSYYDAVGLIEFSSFEEFRESFKKMEQSKSHIPIPDPPETRFFYKTIERLIC